jgi:hypothetical protein
MWHWRINRLDSKLRLGGLVTEKEFEPILEECAKRETEHVSGIRKQQ